MDWVCYACKSIRRRRNESSGEWKSGAIVSEMNEEVHHFTKPRKIGSSVSYCVHCGVKKEDCEKTPVDCIQTNKSANKRPPQRSKLKKVRKWSTANADKLFSRYIRTRDPICKLCNLRPSTDNSHYWRRGHSGTRFDPKNCIGICRPCHDEYEHLKNYDYKIWMFNWLGQEEYEALELRARTFKNRAQAVKECKEFLLTQL